MYNSLYQPSLKAAGTGSEAGVHNPVRHLNYNHLLYFWTVAREGSIAKATQSLHLTPQTISGQLKLLEASVGESLFNRVGRGLAMTETGQGAVCFYS